MLRNTCGDVTLWVDVKELTLARPFRAFQDKRRGRRERNEGERGKVDALHAVGE